jgi:hypothetical protein
LPAIAFTISLICLQSQKGDCTKDINLIFRKNGASITTGAHPALFPQLTYIDCSTFYAAIQAKSAHGVGAAYQIRIFLFTRGCYYVSKKGIMGQYGGFCFVQGRCGSEVILMKRSIDR